MWVQSRAFYFVSEGCRMASARMREGRARTDARERLKLLVPLRHDPVHRFHASTKCAHGRSIRRGLSEGPHAGPSEKKKLIVRIVELYKYNKT